VSDGLMVDYDMLERESKFFEKEANEMDSTLDLMKTNGDFSQAWKDANGTSFNTEFGQFITDAKQINADLRALAAYAQNKVDNYKRIESNHARNMGTQ